MCVCVCVCVCVYHLILYSFACNITQDTHTHTHTCARAYTHTRTHIHTHTHAHTQMFAKLLSQYLIETSCSEHNTSFIAYQHTELQYKPSVTCCKTVPTVQALKTNCNKSRSNSRQAHEQTGEEPSDIQPVNQTTQLRLQNANTKATHMAVRGKCTDQHYYRWEDRSIWAFPSAQIPS